MCIRDRYTPDYKSYEILYTYCDSAWARKAYEFGFVQLCIFFKGIGASYQEFRMIFALIYVIIINFTILRLSNRPNFTLAMYLLWPFIPFVSGIRFAMASAIVCFSIPFLIKNTKSGIIPVSYTHLDVYKRQDMGGERQKGSP